MSDAAWLNQTGNIGCENSTIYRFKLKTQVYLTAAEHSRTSRNHGPCMDPICANAMRRLESFAGGWAGCPYLAIAISTWLAQPRPQTITASPNEPDTGSSIPPPPTDRAVPRACNDGGRLRQARPASPRTRIHPNTVLPSASYAAPPTALPNPNRPSSAPTRSSSQ